MGKICRKPFALLFITAILFGTLGGCDKSPSKTGTLMDFVPENASMVFKISNLKNLQADIEANSLLSMFEKTGPYLFFAEKSVFFKKLHPTAQSLLCINILNDSVSAFTFISKHTENLFQVDSIKNKTVETLQIDKKSFQRITIDASKSGRSPEIAYTAQIDSVFVISSSQKILQDILKGKTERDATFKKVFNLPSSNGFTALMRGNRIAVADSTKIDFTSWSALDVAIAPESLTATGITLATDSIPQLLNVFKEQVPQHNDVAALVPTDALGALSFTFNDAEAFQNNLRTFRGENPILKTTGIFGSVSEVGSISLKSETAIFIKSIDPSLTNDALARFVSSKSMFRETEISSFSEPDLFQKTFSPFINYKKANYVFQLENFFVFTESEETAAQIISSFQNNATLKNTSYFKNTAQDLSSASSLLIFKMQGEFSETISDFFNSKSRADFKNISFDKFPLAALQFSFDRNFAHVTLSCKESGGATKSISGRVSEKFNIQLENPLLGNPHVVKGKNGSVKIVVQDIGNKLYFISESGKILWSKNLGAPILGKIEEVEISGGNQIAFVTQDTFYILDRNGKDVKGFPIKFKDKITRPLSVFDYDNNRNYRFVVVQDKEVFMYDKNGKTVKGFGFNKTQSSIVLSPVHIRMGNKDYIVIAEENGKLNILSRVGKPRISISKKFNFSDIPIAEEDNNFVVITKENTKERIAQDGKVSTLKLNVGNNYWFLVEENTKVTKDDNLLRINGKLVELPLGLYTVPKLFNIGRKTYITITETQEKKVYVFDKNGETLNGFPVYGTSEAAMGEGSSTGLVVKGEANSIVFYGIN
ncbi:hypothetical protein [Aequorivita marisscotiae]|uniref:Uncharacterized protein n=1 Tax=Aequorivita marisscotiae TaxID=3040348 RepID=A0ABY8KX26_9FLAO|nr:hypothetical protein [Aequorivita sp. Ant34-E75]WGF93099.1 hypothetical protein QCQ61_02675 [Aequorivita sp. Ant34-E75]